MPRRLKNFARPVEALREMRRVLRRSASALVIDLRSDATDDEIDDYIAARRRGWMSSMIIRRTFKGMLRQRAYAAEQFRALAAEAGFDKCTIDLQEIGFNAWMTA